MSERNWVARESGARIAEASFESTSGANCAANLLKAREDEFWLAGPVPQHVTLALSAEHPPLQFAGWHVGRDLPTNPKVVEINSGPSLEQLRAVLVCEALPGAGTQMWRLPRAIPAEHIFVRFTIVESFGPGPTYMNTLILLENDPGPHYNASGEAAPTASVSEEVAGSPQRVTPVLATHYASHSTHLPSSGWAERSPMPRRVTPPSGPLAPPAGINMSATPRDGRYADDGGRSDVGMFDTANKRPTTAMNTGWPLQHASPPGRNRSSLTHSPRMRSRSRMSQLLHDLDNDIRLLKPIKAVPRGENMLMYHSQETPNLGTGSFDKSRTPDRGGHRRDSSTSDSDSQRNDLGNDRHRRERHAKRRGSSRGEEDNGGSSRGARRPPMQPSPTDIEICPPPVGSTGSPPPSINAAYEARLNSLERAVAALNEAVQHQRDDLTMIKRLLLQQAVEGRKEAERRFEEKQRYEHMSSPVNSAMVASSTPAAPASSSPPGLTADQRLTHRNITVDFPEDALRAFVKSVLDERLRKYTKKLEARFLHRLDKQLHDVIMVLSATVDGQLSNVANVAAATAAAAATVAAGASVAGPSMHTPPRVCTEQVNMSKNGGRAFSPVSQSSFMQSASRHEVGHDDVYSALRQGCCASSASSKGDASHTPRSQTETGISALYPRSWSGTK
ncbi:hypothetical protein ABL78_4621 [Leptomonas seymouri]|uniref:Uncharacterized protein n=1 Tax=Leptomonas seymouri TaxID=5684 RepID=A0A0N0P5C9_LEPSE|nr:hypothetical protein ABL78_4621 [Leptomonas seymouri]|eukprot:KPI86316.1 hypothetical protein ABL78_4621 [Leptomonas seymouri]